MIKSPVKRGSFLVLGSNRYEDTSALITLASHEGIFSVLAKRVYQPKSNLKPLLIFGNYVDLEYRYQEKISIASSLSVLYDASFLSSDYSKAMFLLFLQELSNTLFRYGDSYPLDEIVKILKALETEDTLSLCLLSLGVFLRHLGLEYTVDSCSVCHRKDHIVSFSEEEGGFLCEDCAKKRNAMKTSEMELHVLRYAFMEVNEKNVKRIVPRSEGRKILTLLTQKLERSFDLTPFKTFSLLYQSLL